MIIYTCERIVESPLDWSYRRGSELDLVLVVVTD